MRQPTKPKPPKRWTPRHWASLKPFGLGEQHPNNFAEVFRAIGENRDQLAYAWRILSQGVCDGCALGTTGLKDWTLDGIHLCNVRLRLLRLNTMPAFDPALLADVTDWTAKGRLPRTTELREHGRVPTPLLRRKGDKGFTAVSWDTALNLIADRIQDSTPERLGFFLTSRGIPNEVYYGVQKAVRALGTNSVDNAARLCHSPSTVGLKKSLGVAATTCSYSDWLKADVVTFFGSNVANNQPVAIKYLHYAKKMGTKVVCVNNYREPGMDKYWIPSLPESALFGTQVTDHFQLINIGGDIAFINGVLKLMLENGWYDADFVARHTNHFDDLRQTLAGQSWVELEQLSGATQAEMRTYPELLRDADKAVFVWSMGITQHELGAEAVQAIINLALLKGFVGRGGCGLMPIRGHSGVQGGAEMGAYATVFPGGRAINAENAAWLSEQYGFPVSDRPGLTATEMIDTAVDNGLDLLFSIGGNWLKVLPEPDEVERALAQVPLRVFMDIVLTPQMLLDPSETVLILPATTRYEIPGGVTETSTERRVIFSPEIAGPRIRDAWPEHEVLADLVGRVHPQWRDKVGFENTAVMREEISRVIPFYKGIEQLHQQGDQFQYGGPHLCAGWQFPTADGRANFAAINPPQRQLAPGQFALTTRRGKQFNSIVHAEVDALNGAGREAILMNPADAHKLGLQNGQRIRLQNEIGVLEGQVFTAAIAPGNLQVHWPEGNVLIPRGCIAPAAGVPDYNATVRVETMSKEQ